MNQNMFFYLIAGILAIIIIIVILIVMRQKKKTEYKKIINNLEYEKNQIATSSAIPELAKVEDYVKNERLEMMYDDWKERLNDIIEVRIPKITDMLIEAEYSLSKKDYKSTMYKIAKLEMELYKVRTKSEFLLNEIKDLTTSEERSRAVITKLKARYRKLYEQFNEHVNEYADYAKIVAKQFENISKRFEDFEIILEQNEYSGVDIIVKAVEEMLKHMEVVVEELPSIVLIAENILPTKIKDIENIYLKMTEEGYPLDYLNIEFNIEEANKKIADILTRAKELNLEDSLFDLKVLTDYFEKVYTDFDKEKIVKLEYEEANETLKNKLIKTNELVYDIFDRLEDLQMTYNLKEKDIENLNNVKNDLEHLNNDYKNLLDHTGNNSFPYSKLKETLENLITKLSNIEANLDRSLNVLGSMHDDEQRARQQLSEVQTLLYSSTDSLRSYNLPVIPNSYYVELREARDAIKEIVKELTKQPIEIEILNTRVDTARDLALKLYGKTREMLKMAMFAEMAIVYGNRFRTSYPEVDKYLMYSETLFNKGEYKKSLETSINVLNKLEPGIYDRLLNLYGQKD